MSEHTKQPAAEDPRAFWEQLYAGAAPVWSGRVNRTLAEAVAGLPPGRSLDLGCGEGGDVLWLAERGWEATGLDLSETAVHRAREAARAWLGAPDGSVDDADFESDDSSVDRAADGPVDNGTAGGSVGGGTVDGTADGSVDGGTADGTAEGSVNGGTVEGTVDGTADGSVDGVVGGARGSSLAGSGVATFVVADLADWVDSGAETDGNPDAFDLITASFLQSPVELPRERILRAALDRLAPGGSLVLISHAAPPPWVIDGDAGSGHDPEHDLGTESNDRHGWGPGGVGGAGAGSGSGTGGHRHGAGSVGEGHQHGAGAGGPKFFSPDEELEMLGLSRLDAVVDDREAAAGDTAAPPTSPGRQYTVIAAEVRKREVSDPEGKPALIDDSLVIVRRADTAQ